MAERRVRTVGRPTYGRPQPTYRRQQRSPLRLPGNLTQRRLLLLAGLVLAVLVGLNMAFSVRTVTVTSSARASEIEAATHKAIDASWTQGNLLTLDAERLATDVVVSDPYLKTVKVERRWPRGLSVSAVLKQPSIGWSSGNQNYLLDRDGAVIGPLPPGSQVPVVTDASNVPAEVGKRVASGRFVAFVGEMVTGLGQQGVGVTKIEVRDTTLDLYVSTNKGYQIIFDTSRTAASEVGDLKTVLTTLTREHRAATQYIDLRIAGKAYFK